MTFVVPALILLLAVSIGDVQSVSLRLYYYGSTYHSYGRLEMYYSGQWIPFTITGFNMHEADLACRRLGYGYASRYATVGYFGYGQASTTYSVYNLVCSSSATSFSSCTYSRSRYYSHSRDVGLQCTNSKSSLKLLTTSGYPASSSGRLQIFINNTWGTVCNNNFGSQEAGIACRQLGFTGSISYNSARNTYPYSSYYVSGPIWYNVNRCSYYSTDLRNCTSSVGSNYCTHSQDVILTCYGSTYSPPYYTVAPTASSGSLRLVPNSYGSNSGGRLEIYYYNYGYAWRPFCSTYFSSHEADLACKKLGYLRASSYGRVGNLGYSQGTGSYSIRSDCSSYTSRFDSCYKSVTSSCSHYYDVALNCVNYTSPTDYFTELPNVRSGDVRLVSNGYSSAYLSQGRLEIYYRNSNYRYSWMPFCYSGFSSKAADSACRQLGYVRASTYDTVGYMGFSQSTSSYSISSVYCYSSKSYIRYCNVYSSDYTCSHYNDVAISCTDEGTTSTGLIIGLVFGSLILCSSLFIGIMLCAVVIVMYRKKSSHPRTVNVVQNPPDVNYRMSDLAAQETVEVPAAAPQSVPSQFTTAVPSQTKPSQFTTIDLQKEDHYPQNGASIMHSGGSGVVKEESKDDVEDLYPSDDDEKPLIS